MVESGAEWERLYESKSMNMEFTDLVKLTLISIDFLTYDEIDLNLHIQRLIELFTCC